MGPNFMDELDCGSFFDHIDDLIEFPPENECSGVGAGDCKDFPSIWKDTLPENNPLFPSSNSNSASDLSTELAVPYEDIVQLEWLSTFMEDSFADGGMTIAKENGSFNKEPSHNQFQTPSPVSVLESSTSSTSSSGSCSGGKTNPISPSHRGPQRARSKRPRPATFNPRPAIQLVSPTSSFVETPQPFVGLGESEYIAESQPVNKVSNLEAPEQKKKKKIKLTFSSASPQMDQNPLAQPVRKCLHCEITKTPQWRTGPLGPKTLCNACGVRYKSGRLFPEYRPAASPTFVPSLHSNSHKKVLEMRNKVTEEGNTPETATTTQPEPSPNTNPSLD